MKFPRSDWDGPAKNASSIDGGNEDAPRDGGREDDLNDDVLSEESIAARLDEQLATGLRVLETCGVHQTNAAVDGASSTARVRGGNGYDDNNGNDNGNNERRRLRVPKPEGGLAANERAMLAGGMDDDDGDARLAYGDDGDDDGEVAHDAGPGHAGSRNGSSAERGDAIRWFMFPSEASRMLKTAVQAHSAGGVLPLDYLPEVRGVAGAMRPPASRISAQHGTRPPRARDLCGWRAASTRCG